MEKLKKDRKASKAAFTRKANIFDKLILVDGHIDVLQEALDKVNDNFIKIETLHEQMVELCESDSELESFEQYICELEERKTTSNNIF